MFPHSSGSLSQLQSISVNFCHPLVSLVSFSRFNQVTQDQNAGNFFLLAIPQKLVGDFFGGGEGNLAEMFLTHKIKGSNISGNISEHFS